MKKLWAAVSDQGTVLAELLHECSAPPVPLGPQGAIGADWPQEDILSIAASDEVGEQELAFTSEDIESDGMSPEVELFLSAELLLLLKRATSFLQVPWPTEGETRQSIFDDEPTIYPMSPGNNTNTPSHREYYHFRQAWIPLRWLPAESIFEDDFSTKSDVWSFGVLMWEVFTHGEQPYIKLTDDEVLAGLPATTPIPPPTAE
ncbi:UNVERIFIED_CONTAM: hypothetical protein FKN15_067104 [Acipenser sinensis]